MENFVKRYISYNFATDFPDNYKLYTKYKK